MKKTRLAHSIGTGFSHLWAAMQSHPVEIVILLYSTIAATLPGHSWWQLSASYAVFTVTAALSLSRYRSRSHGMQWLYYAVIAIHILTGLLPGRWHDTTEFYILAAMMPAAYLLTLPTRPDSQYRQRFYRLLRSTAIAIGIAIVLEILCILIIFSIEALFNVLVDRYIEICSRVSFCFIAPLVFISLESHAETPTVSRLEEVVVNYILTPALLVYNVILYVYLAVILIRWQLPEGSVSAMVLAFTVVAVAIMLVRPLLAMQPLRWYFRWFPLFALPLIVLFWVAVGYRVGQYGITLDRCILIAAGSLMTLYLAAVLIFRAPETHFNYWLTAFLVLCGVVLSVGGPLSARQTTLRSQLAIIRHEAADIGILSPEGSIDTNAFVRSDGDTLYRRQHRTIYQAMHYIYSDMRDTALLQKQLGMTSPEYLDRLSHKTAEYATAWRPDNGNDNDEELYIEHPSMYLYDNQELSDLDIAQYRRMSVNVRYADNKGLRTIPYPGGAVDADSLLATQLAKVGYTLASNIDKEVLRNNSHQLCLYRSADDNVCIIFSDMNFQRIDRLYHLTSVNIRCALSR